MHFFNILTIAVVLAMDAFAVSLVVGMNLQHIRFRQVFRLSWHFGLFQALMPVMGWNMGRTVYSLIEQYDHWVAFGLLLCVGGNMIREAFQPDQREEEQCQKDPTKGLTLIMLSVATSIDAFAIGFSFSMLHISIVFPVIVIGFVAALLTVIGLHIGNKVGTFSSKIRLYAESLGGIVLWCIGIHILYEHGVFDLLGTF